MRLEETAKEFQADIGRIAAAAGRTAEDVYALWQQYVTQCTDQSAVLFEFIQWYEADLGGDHAKLVDAIDARHTTTISAAVADSNARNGIPEVPQADQADAKSGGQTKAELLQQVKEEQVAEFMANGCSERYEAQGRAIAVAERFDKAKEEPAPEEQPQKWVNSAEDPAGKIQCKRFDDVRNKINSEHNTRREKWGVIGGEEHESCMVSLFGVNVRPDVRKVQLEIGKRYGWTVTRSNVNKIIADMEAAWPELAKNRPCDDKRRTAEQDAADHAEHLERENKRRADEAAKTAEADRIALELRAKYPWARPASEALSNHARAAANVREELSRTFPGITFSVRSDYNSIRIAWEMGPDERQVDEITKKYKNGHWNGQEDIHEYDSSAYGKAVEKVLGRVTYFSNSRRYDTVEHSQLLGPILSKLAGGQWDPTREAWNQKLPDGESVGTAVRIILANTSFPPGAVITGLERNETDECASGRDYHLLYKVVYTTPTAATGKTQFGAGGELGTVQWNREHNGVEIAFTDKPSDELRWKLKRAGFRITRRPPWKWYQKFSQAAWVKACELAGVKADAPKATEDPGPDRFDMQVEDNMAAACGL